MTKKGTAQKRLPAKASKKKTAVHDKKLPLVSHRRTLFGILKYDLEYTTLDELHEKIHGQSHFSVLYFTLLISSVLVCSLGLLTDNTAVVIGGMLIAPLTWPLARIGFGIARRNSSHIFRGFMLVIASIFIGAISAYLITAISPIKLLNEEILSRTAPTLMDLFIALAAGIVAAIAITQKKIADSLAGVAIAVALMPPLCTVGITLGLRQYSFAAGALLLFVVNAACITLVTALLISFNIYLRTKKFKIALRATLFNFALVAALAVPLAIYLNSYSTEIRSYNAVTNEIDKYVSGSENAASFENIQVERVNASTINVSADLLLPSDSLFTYEDNEALIERIKSVVGGEVLLNLRIQTIIKPISKDQQDNQLKIQLLSDQLSAQLTKIDDSFVISSINVSPNIGGEGWLISGEVLSDPDSVPSSLTLAELDSNISNYTNEAIELNLTFLPRLTLRTSEQTNSQEIRKLVEGQTSLIDGGAEVSSFTVTITGSSANISYTITALGVDQFNSDYLQSLKQRIESNLDLTVNMRVRLVQANDISI